MTQAPADAAAMTINVIPFDNGCTYKKFKRDNCFLIHQTIVITQLNNTVSIPCMHAYILTSVAGSVEESASLCVISEAVVGVSSGTKTILESVNED